MGKQITDGDVIVHGFELNGKNEIPTEVLQFLSRSSEVKWAMKGTGDVGLAGKD